METQDNVLYRGKYLLINPNFDVPKQSMIW